MVYAAGCLLAAWPAGAQTGKETFGVVWENDTFSGNDRDYTNGIQFSWVQHGAENMPKWTLRLLDPWREPGSEVGHGYFFGQTIFTPSDITLRDPPRGERPYAGWLYGGMGVGLERGQKLDLVLLTLGAVGPASLAEQTQKAVHKIVNSDEPMGWDTQLGAEPGVVLTYQRSWRAAKSHTLGGLELDTAPHAGFALGNVYTYANAGFTLRYGSRLPSDWGPPRISPGIFSGARLIPGQPYAWYFFAGIEGRAVAHNIFLDGNTFKDSRSVDRKPFVGDFQFGVVFSWSTVRVSYTQVRRTREFETQRAADSFGALSLSVAL